MKKIAAVLLTVFMVMSLSACSKNSNIESSDNLSVENIENKSDISLSETKSDSESDRRDTGTSDEEETKGVNGTNEDATSVDDIEAAAGAESEEENITEDGNQILVAYFSCTNTTRPLAEYAADSLNADLYEIVPVEPYTDADLDYHDDNSRSTIEMNDPAARPAISDSVENMEQYDIVFIGYPIWWGEAPRIVSTFMESYDFSGKTIVPFCTSGGSGIGSSATNLEELTNGATWLSGSRLDKGSSRETIVEWINGLGLNVTAQ